MLWLHLCRTYINVQRTFLNTIVRRVLNSLEGTCTLSQWLRVFEGPVRFGVLRGQSRNCPGSTEHEEVYVSPLRGSSSFGLPGVYEVIMTPACSRSKSRSRPLPLPGGNFTTSLCARDKSRLQSCLPLPGNHLVLRFFTEHKTSSLSD